MARVVPWPWVLLHGLARLPVLDGVHHSWLIECSRSLDLLSERWMGLLHVRSHGAYVQRTRDPEGPWERSTLVREVDAHQVRVHGGSSTGQATVGVDGKNTFDQHDTQQGGLHGSDSATHASAHRTRELGRR
jgi:hypothetical protein